MTFTDKILVGGQALKDLGSPRHTNDVDYLVFIDGDYKNQFIFDKENNIDYINGNSSNFFNAIYNLEKGNTIASAQSLFELKAFAYLSHVRNFNQNKMNDCVYDLKFLNINFGINRLPTLSKFATKSEINEILNLI